MRYWTKLRFGSGSFLLILFALIGCIEFEIEPATSFRTVLGELGPTRGRKIIPMDDGTYLILGSQSITTERITDLGGEEIIDYQNITAPSISRIDEYGKLVKGSERIYPMDYYNGGFVEFDVTYSGSFVDLVKLPNGGFVAMGEWSEVDLFDPVLFGQQVFEGVEFLAWLDSDFRLESILSFNGEEVSDHFVGSTPYTFGEPDLFQMSNGQVFVVLHSATPGCSGFGGPCISHFVIREVLDNSLGPIARFFPSVNGTNWDSSRNEDVVESLDGNIIVVSEQVENRNDIFERKFAAYGITIIDPSNLQEISTTQVEFLQTEINGKNNVNKDSTPKELIVNGDGSFSLFYNDFPHTYMMELDSDFAQSRAGVSMARGEAALALWESAVMAGVSDDSGNKYGLSLVDDKDDLNGRGTIVKFDSGGQELWRRDIQGSPTDIATTPDGGVLVISNSKFLDGDRKAVLIKLDENGN